MWPGSPSSWAAAPTTCEHDPMSGPHDLASQPAHLGLGATVDVEPELTGDMDWYAGYVERHASDGFEGRLVSMHTFTESWDSWEVHPNGHELVVCTAGSIELVQEIGGEERTVTLGAGQYAVNDPGVWHTANVAETCTVVFVTAGLGTDHRPR